MPIGVGIGSSPKPRVPVEIVRKYVKDSFYGESRKLNMLNVVWRFDQTSMTLLSYIPHTAGTVAPTYAIKPRTPTPFFLTTKAPIFDPPNPKTLIKP